jgi:hypothetical protein
MMSVVTLAAALESASTSALDIGSFKPLPKGALAQGEILFTRLRASQLATVGTNQSVAVRIAEASYGGGSGSRVVLVSLGGYVDKNDIVHDWIGTTTHVPRAIPSYIVRIFDPSHVLLGLSSNNHYWNVIVNADSGRVIGAFSYD